MQLTKREESVIPDVENSVETAFGKYFQFITRGLPVECLGFTNADCTILYYKDSVKFVLQSIIIIITCSSLQVVQFQFL